MKEQSLQLMLWGLLCVYGMFAVERLKVSKPVWLKKLKYLGQNEGK
ncbi:hypothetical protein CHY_0819 [Carboxydothermus hydrogenoformans Z-2901]|uniref:Uncharacterized protein n=1 Tax=Carboxydothermus hydrogenoformans (strain ATCC BAA-161 / DSM 6008 / Z-2901) TaxID=246194 RepID=Q3ADW1_CARHZ|nr:hypothetical protein CHY_0819 [Carboxydothermus hydrogenoformans Z-2901]